MKYIGVFLLALVLGSIGVWLYFTRQSLPPVKAVSSFSLAKAPSASLLASLVSFSGKVNWESRIATQSVRLTEVRNLQQGEALDTEEAGHAVLVFPGKSLITLSPQTKINLIQTLPTNIVIAQPSGTVQYDTIGTALFSVRADDLLLNITSGSITVKNDTDTHLVSVTVHTGVTTAAYTDLENMTQLASLSAGEHFTYDTTTQDGSVN